MTQNPKSKPEHTDPIIALNNAIKHASKEWVQSKSIKKKYERLQLLQSKLVEKQQAYDKEMQSKVEEYDPHKINDFFDIGAWFVKLKYRFNIQKAMLANIELTSGDHVFLKVYPNNESFVWKEGIYVIDPKLKYYNHSAKMYALDYHQDFALPVQRKIPILQIRDATGNAGVTDIENATNPRVLKTWLDTDIITKVMKGQEIDALLRSMRFLLYIIVVVAVVHLLLYVNKSGMLSAIHF